MPREIIGPVIIVFSLEGVISGLFDLYVPRELEIVGWFVIFLLSISLVAHWGTTGDASNELSEKVEEVKE